MQIKTFSSFLQMHAPFCFPVLLHYIQLQVHFKIVILETFLFFLTLMGMMIPGSDLIMTFKGSYLSVILGYCRISLTCGKIGLTLIHDIEYLLFRFSSSPAY